jgi:hypothetical protein
VGDVCDACPDTNPGIAVDPTGCPAVRVGPDFDDDGDVDLEDFGLLQKCLSGSSVPQTDPLCEDTRLDADDDVDIHDMTIFLQCLSGTDVAPAPDCETGS